MADDTPQAMGDPAVHAPRGPSPIKRTHPSRSLSRASSQHYGRARDFDPILRNLSPTTTLRAFSENGLLTPSDLLQTCLQSSTSSQRALGTKAAQTCLDVRSWARELEEWEWPGTFDVPGSTEKKHWTNTTALGGLISQESQYEAGGPPEYWGSLPAATVKEYDQRADEIMRQLDEIDVEELKDFVLSAHNEAGSGSASIDDSIGAIGAATDLRRLDDFTAIITATILQALPYLSRLNRLLDTWTIRLAILRQVPKFLDALAQARRDLDRAWAAITAAQPDIEETSSCTMFTRGTMIELQSIIERKVGGLGRRLDGFLDDLEGRSETVPDGWIEEMETLEQQYADWTVQAERKILDDELKKRNRESKYAARMAAQANAKVHGMPVTREHPEQAIAGGDPNRDDGFLEPHALAISNSTRENGVTPMDRSLIASPPLSPPASLYLAQSFAPELPRNDSETIPSQQADHIIDRSPARSNTNSRRSSRSRRHVPIMLHEFGGDGQEYPTEGVTGDPVSRTQTPMSEANSASSSQPNETSNTSFAKKRALFAGDLERTQSLQKTTKSPVRPFEHASNAFARLFKSEAPQTDRSRSSSLRSEVARSRSGSAQTENGIIWGGIAPPSPKGSPRRKTLDSSLHSAEGGQNGSSKGPVSADADAPPVPSLPPKSPKRSLQSPMKFKASQHIPSSPQPPQTETIPRFDVDENWPLSGAMLGTDPLTKSPVARLHAQTLDALEGSGLSSPRTPLESDSFDRKFIESLPGTPDGRPSSPAVQDERADDPPSDLSNALGSQSSAHQTVVPTMDPSMLYRSPASRGEATFSTPHASGSTPSSVQRPSHIDMPSRVRAPVSATSTDVPVTPNSIASDTYSPEIQNARVSYFQVASPELSRNNSVATTQATTSANLVRPASSHTLSNVKIRNPSPEEEVINEDEAVETFSARRASKISMESQPRLEIKSIDLLRRKSSSSAVELDAHLPRRESSPSAVEPNTQPAADIPSSPISHREMSLFPTPPTIHEERPGSPVSPLPETPNYHGLHHKTSNLSVVSDQETPASNPAAKKGVLNSFMSKRRGLGIQSNKSPTVSHTSETSEADSFDRHVSEVLQKLPAPIRFRSGATTPQPRAAEPRNFSGPRPKLTPRASSRASMGPGGLTLAPADPSPNKRSPAANEPEVKLYHLTQAGREEPIKLFVRLVGEGERVMVRVGGGWADLADYLRQYAEHHGSRTVSGEVDVKAVSSSTPGGSSSSVHPALRRKASGPLSAEVNRSKSNSPSPVTSIQEHNEGSENTDPSLARTPSRPPLPPKSASRPSTADSNRPGSKHSWAEINMSGPGGSGKKAAELPEQKARWVEGMMERVKNASAEKKGEDKKQKYFGELGKVGGTRRVVFRQSSGLDGPRG